MPYSDKELVELGSRFSTQRLIEQANVSIAMARAHAAELQKKFPPARVDELEAIITEIKAKFGTQAEAKESFGTGNAPVTEKIRDAKKWITGVITSADNAYEEEPERRDEFHKAGKIGTSVPKIAGRLQVLVTLAEKHKADLAPWGIDDADLDRGRSLLAELSAADTAQEQAVKNLPATTKALYIQKAKAYLLLKKLARAARDTFRDTPAIAVKLNMEILQRHGRKHNGGDETPATGDISTPRPPVAQA